MLTTQKYSPFLEALCNLSLGSLVLNITVPLPLYNPVSCFPRSSQRNRSCIAICWASLAMWQRWRNSAHSSWPPSSSVCSGECQANEQLGQVNALQCWSWITWRLFNLWCLRLFFHSKKAKRKSFDNFLNALDCRGLFVVLMSLKSCIPGERCSCFRLEMFFPMAVSDHNKRHAGFVFCKMLSKVVLEPHNDLFSLGSNLLESKADGIEVSYNACGVLSHIMFDGPEAWGICEPHREEVVKRMWAAIQSWDINSRRNINYRWGIEKYDSFSQQPGLSQKASTNRQKGKDTAERGGSA